MVLTVRILAGVSALLLAATLGCSSESSSSSSSSSSGGAPSVKKTVGPEGDTIDVGGATVTIPKGALAAPTEITITATEAPPPDGFVALSKVFTCEPSGTNFTTGVTMKMPFTDDGKGPSTMWWSSGADPTFKDVGGAPVNGTMSATVMHFSSGFVGRKK